MKKAFIALSIIVCFAAGVLYGILSMPVSNSTAAQPSANLHVGLQEMMNQADTATAVAIYVITEAAVQTPTPTASIAMTNEDEEPVDYDFTKLSSTMAYSQIFNMIIDKEAYVGKTVRIIGTYSPSYFPPTGQTYHYVAVWDATACCQQGLEFIWNGEHTYPDDYPAANSLIKITGVFDMYTELDVEYLYIRTDSIELV